MITSRRRWMNLDATDCLLPAFLLYRNPSNGITCPADDLCDMVITYLVSAFDNIHPKVL